MTTYKSYAEAKIDNPDSEIVTTGKYWSWHYSGQRVGTFEKQGSHTISEDEWVICNPADHCSSLKEFLEAGFKLVEGDKFIGVSGNVISVKNYNESNIINDIDVNRYILSASTLNGGCKIPAKSEQWTIYNNTLPLCELTDEQAAMLFNAWRSGDNIQYRTMNVAVWIDKLNSDTGINKHGVYRVKSKSERELFIDAVGKVIGYTDLSILKIGSELFDSGKFKYIDSTNHFGESI